METFREHAAYVLLGEPGSGKTEAFREEAKSCGGCYITARDFVTFKPRPEWEAKPVFIDGLDEMRAGGGDGRTQLDAIRARLEELGGPPFRLSCREADWLGASDQSALNQVSPDGRVAVLHLDDLTEDQVIAILSHTPTIPDVMGFIKQARERRLDDLLRNPQTLKMLTEALSDGKWPGSRRETYELACRKLATEHSQEHRHARQGQTVASDDLLDAAGHLFAIQLLAGLAGFAMDRAMADDFHFPVEELGLELAPALRQALKTRLFTVGKRDEQRCPIHRSVAEFLGARHLARLIANHGLPLGRVLALMTGEDGGVVADLRGLHAWLAVHCLPSRDTLIDRDPLGVVLYGDARRFPKEDKRRLLQALQQEAQRYPWFRSSDWAASPFGALGTQEMADDFSKLLRSPARDEAHQSLLACVLDALIHGDTLPELAESLMAVVRDVSYWPVIRKHALRALIHATEKNDDAGPFLILLADIHAGAVGDADDELLGVLLDQLYPERLPAAQLIDYLRIPKVSNFLGKYAWFWEHTLFEKTKEKDLPVLLDGLVQYGARLHYYLHDFHLKRFIGGLLVRTVEAYGDAVSTERLFHWLGVGVDRHGSVGLENEQKGRIAAWITAHPDCYRSLLLHGIERCKGKEDFRVCMFRQEAYLYWAVPPADLAEWCLHQAEVADSDELARHFFDQAFQALLMKHGHEEFPLESMAAWVEKRPRFQSWLGAWLVQDYDDSWSEVAQQKQQRNAEDRERRNEWLRFLRGHFAAIEDGSAPPKVLHDLAMIYWGHYYEAQGDTPRKRLENFLDGDEALIQAALIGLRRSLERGDLPTVREIVDLAQKGKEHYICAACLVGMEQVYLDDPRKILDLDDGLLARMIAFRLTHHAGNSPDWFELLVRERPALVSEGLVAYACPMLKAGKEYVAKLNRLAHDDAYEDIARQSVPSLLSGFPLRAKKTSHPMLKHLLKAALRYIERDRLLNLIEDKLRRPSLDQAQRVLWLAAGLMTDPDRFEGQLESHVGKSQARAATLAGFLHNDFGDWHPKQTLPETAIALLIRLLAPGCTPERPQGTFMVSDSMRAADMVRSLIHQLGSRPDEHARAELNGLLALPSLAPWHEQLRQALETQRVSRREAMFQHPAAPAIVQTLGNLQPANRADLAALVLDQLHEVGDRLRHGDTNSYRAFWDGDKPALENDCRDRLLDLLRPRLAPLGIEAQKEGYFAEDKHADIRISYEAGRFIVPIEIKRDCHDQLWQALRDQLMTRYAPDPGARGHGIYLVLWFGGKGMPMPPTGARPQSAQELEERLMSLLKPEERNLISLCVFDCSRCGSSATRGTGAS